MWRTKEVFRAVGRLEGVIAGSQIIGSFGAGDRARYRFAFRTGPYAYGLGVIVVMGPPISDTAQNSYARLDIANAAGTVVASQTFVYGASSQPAGTQVEGWQYLKQIFNLMDGLSPDTEYFGTFYDVDYGRIQSACAFELTTLTASEGGYLAQNFANRSGIVDKTRENQATIVNALWQKGGAQVFNWTVNDGTSPRTTTSTTPANILDTTITTVSAASPGWTLDMTGKARVAQDELVPVVMAVCGMNPTSTSGAIKLVDATGTTVMSITGGWSTAGPGWQTTTGYLPAGVDKYDLMFSTSAGTFRLYAASFYEYG